MEFNKIVKNALLIIVACLALSACATKKAGTGQMQGDVSVSYTHLRAHET